MPAITIALDFPTATEAMTFLSSLTSSPAALTACIDPSPVVIEAAAAKEATSVKKSVKTEAPAATTQPAVEQPKAATSASSKKDDKPASTAKVEVDYTKTTLPNKIAGYLGDKTADEMGYATRRSNLIDLLTSFNVKKGPELKPEQFAEFEVALDRLSAAEAETEETLG